MYSFRLCRFFCLCICSLLFGHLEQLLLMLQSHVVDFHVRKCAILQCLLDRQTRIIGMYMHLDYIIVSNTYNRITDRFQICLEIHLLFDIESSVQKYDKFCTISKFYIRFCLRIHRFTAYSLCGARFLLTVHIQIDLFAQKCIVGSGQYLYQSLSAGIHYASLF